MKKALFVLGLSAFTALPLPAMANDANTVFNGISAATGVIGIFQRSNTNKHLNDIDQAQQRKEYREYRRDQASERAAAERAAANRRAAAQKVNAERKAAEQLKLQAAENSARQDEIRRQKLEALKYNL